MGNIEEMCGSIHKAFRSLKRFRYPFDGIEMPLNGLYVFFEKGEFSHGGDRIVRVGTHTGKDQLRSRLMQHIVNENKDRSIFRKNVGRALLNKAGDSEMLKMWDRDMTTAMAKKNALGYDISKINKVEERVSEFMRNNLSFAVIGVDDKSDRLNLESRLISAISLCNECRSSNEWLGNFSPKPKIVESGLWLVNELYKEPFSDNELEHFLGKYFPKK